MKVHLPALSSPGLPVVVPPVVAPCSDSVGGDQTLVVGPAAAAVAADIVP